MSLFDILSRFDKRYTLYQIKIMLNNGSIIEINFNTLEAAQEAKLFFENSNKKVPKSSPIYCESITDPEPITVSEEGYAWAVYWYHDVECYLLSLSGKEIFGENYPPEPDSNGEESGKAMQ